MILLGIFAKFIGTTRHVVIGGNLCNFIGNILVITRTFRNQIYWELVPINFLNIPNKFIGTHSEYFVKIFPMNLLGIEKKIPVN